MSFGQCRAPCRPMLARQQRRLDPFRQAPARVPARQRQLPHPLVRNALGQAIDRLAKRDLAGLRGLQHLGMDDLPLVSPGIELADDGALLVQRQLLLRPGRVVEEGQGQRVVVAVAGKDAKRRLARTGPDLDRRDVEHDDPPEQRRAGGGRSNPIDRPGRQMIGKIDRPREVEPGQRLGDARPNALQRLDFGEQGIEDVGPHRARP